MLRHAHITDADLYMGAKEMVGLAKKFAIPSIETTQVEHETLGSIGVLKLPRRGLSALDGSITLMLEDPEAARAFLNPRKAVEFQLHKHIDAFNAMGHDDENSATLITLVTAMFHKVDPGEYEKSDGVEFSAEFSATKLLQRVSNDETPLVEIDLMANVHKVNGEHVWAR